MARNWRRRIDRRIDMTSLFPVPYLIPVSLLAGYLTLHFFRFASFMIPLCRSIVCSCSTGAVRHDTTVYLSIYPLTTTLSTLISPIYNTFLYLFFLSFFIFFHLLLSLLDMFCYILDIGWDGFWS
jgi:hypothetical protein